MNHVRRTREEFPRAVLMAGNVVTGEMTEELVQSQSPYYTLYNTNSMLESV